MPSGFPFRTKGRSDYAMQFFSTQSVLGVTPSSQTTATLITLDTGVITGVVGQAVFSGSIATTVLTVAASPVPTGAAIATTMTVLGAGVTAATTISSLGTGSGGAGTYNINNSQTVTPAEPMTAFVAPAAVKLPRAEAGRIITVVNTLGTASNVYPYLGDQINAAGANVAFSLAASTVALFYCGVIGSWWQK